jgi:hypothetical protein
MTIGDSSAPLAAARAVAVERGVRCDDAVVIAMGSNVLVHLKPSRVVARVMTGTAALHDDVARWLEREVAVGVFAADQGGPIVPPSELIAPGPYEHDGSWMTFWKFVARSPDAGAVGRSLRELHDVLASFTGDLEPFSGIRDQIDRQLAELHPCGWLSGYEIELLRSELRRLTPTAFTTSVPVQPIHGDAGLGNLLGSRAGLLWNDLEDVCTGPVGWDVAGAVASARARARSENYVASILAAYGGPDLDALRPFLELDALAAAAWQAFDTQRRRPSTTTPPRWFAQSLARLPR